MLSQFDQFFAITRNTFVESIRQPIFLVIILIGKIALVLNPMLAAYTMDDDNKLLIDMGLSTLLLSGLILAAFTATGVLSREIENNTVLTVVSKPVARPIFILGKFFGVAGALLIAYWILTAVFLLSLRQEVLQTASDDLDAPVLTFGFLASLGAVVAAAISNFYTRRPFASTLVILWAILMTSAWAMTLFIGKEWKFQSPSTDWNPQLMIGLVMIFWAVMVLTALAIAVSTRLKEVMTLVICIAFYILAVISDYMFGRPAIQEQYAIARVAYLVMPNFQFFWPADALTQGHNITASYFGMITAYAAVYTAVLLAIAAALFQTREVG